MASQAAYRLLFYRTGSSGKPELPESLFLRQLGELLNCEALPDKLNCLIRMVNAAELPGKLFGELFESFVSHGILPGELTGGNLSEDAVFLLENAALLCKTLKELTSGMPEKDLARLMPKARKIFQNIPDFTGDIGALAQQIAASDPFHCRRVFTYAAGKFRPVEPSSVKDVKKFFGFPGVKVALGEHFSDFAAGKTSLPLLINSLPGYGKTSMVISFALSVPGTVVILPEPEALESSWHQLIGTLSSRSDRRFVIFFDDIDPRSVDWYNFRTNVGGAFTPPGNIMPVLAANYEFPPSILSRGRRISYPVFDEERCMEMIEDFLASFGMQRPPRNIVSLMGAQYTEDFGQKKFTELSPRTLMRHLAVYEHDARKRRQIVELSGGGMVTRPDAELFYEFNIELMRSLYGEEYIQRLLKERLKSL
ncbi:MAG: hypothetical protein IKC82_05210 [Lentisphaeria bacterium]|nr:hypothetical protein [Lentisphaeria bacterium]